MIFNGFLKFNHMDITKFIQLAFYFIRLLVVLQYFKQYCDKHPYVCTVVHISGHFLGNEGNEGEVTDLETGCVESGGGAHSPGPRGQSCVGSQSQGSPGAPRCPSRASKTQDFLSLHFR